MTTRRPAVSGQFYPGTEEALKKEVRQYLDKSIKRRRVMGVVSPHAGYMYSGHVAGATFSHVEIPKTCIVLSPNHTGLGAAAALMTDGDWLIPTGSVPIDDTIAGDLLSRSQLISRDTMAHISEHSLEVQLPFLLELQKELMIVPMTIKHMGYEKCEEIGRTIAETIKAAKRDILIVASSDMTHYESDAAVRSKDQWAIDRVLDLDPKGLLNTCAAKDITMCGVIPTAIMLVACKELGATKAELIKHSTSGDITGELDAVVGYAGMIVY